MTKYYYDSELNHHGIKGQKWGTRRWQNEDGSLTPAGREHYGYGEGKERLKAAKANLKAARRENDKAFNSAYGYSSRHMISQYVGKKAKAESTDRWNKYRDADAKWRAAKQEVKAAKKQIRDDKRTARIAKDQAKFDQLDRDLAKARKGATKSDVVKKQYADAGRSFITGTVLKMSSGVVGASFAAFGKNTTARILTNALFTAGSALQVGGAINAVGTTNYALNKKRK